MSTLFTTGSATLRVLNIGFNHVGDNGISVIAEWLLSNKTLTKLYASYCRLSVKGNILYNMLKYIS